jgi:ABC-2 type transport system ATP-binding protein
VPLLRADNLTKRYPGDVLALNDFSVELEPGLIGLVGANGAGKSTFIKILLGLLRPTSGSVSVLGLDPTADPIAVRQRIGYLPEHDCLPLDQSATDFITHMARISGLPHGSARERAAEMLRHVGLYEERYRRMDGYSTGMKQRVKLAQSLVHDPALLLLDEPTNGLDPNGRDEMLDLIRRTGEEFGISVVVSSHVLGEIERVCGYLISIDNGALVHAAAIGSFTAETAVLAVDVDEGAAELAARLVAAGLDVRTDERGGLHIGLADERPYDLVRDLAAELALPLVRIQRTRQRLDELFRAAPAMPAAPDRTSAPRGEG